MKYKILEWSDGETQISRNFEDLDTIGEPNKFKYVLYV